MRSCSPGSPRPEGARAEPLVDGTFTFQQCALDDFALLDRLGTDRFPAIGVGGGVQALLHVATPQPSRGEAMVLVRTAPYFPGPARKSHLWIVPNGGHLPIFGKAFFRGEWE